MSDGEPADGDGANDGAHEDRAPIVLKVEYKRLNTFFYDYTKNISKGGTFIKTDRPLAIGTMFLFRLIFPVTGDPTLGPIELRGEVRWVVGPGETTASPPPSPSPSPSSPPSPGPEPGMGIRFVYGDPDERGRLDRTVERMMVHSLGQLIYSRLLGSGAGNSS
jgi:type IV pilus assembly protein PilZ